MQMAGTPKLHIVHTLVFCCLLTGFTLAEAQAQTMKECDPAQAVEYLTTLLKGYPDQAIATEMSDLIRSNLVQGRYDDLETREALAKALTADVRSVRRDFHLGVMYSPVPPTDDAGHNLDKPEVLERLSKENFGFDEVRILDGNVGFLHVSALYPTSVAGDTAQHALGFLQNVDALIIDVRNNLGGEPDMVRLIQSAFFAQPTHLNTLHYTDGRDPATDEIWTDPSLVTTHSLADVPIAVLTSLYVASGAEDFAYSLQARGRAVIIGERTLGASHPGESHYNEALQLNFSVPHGYVVNPVTQTDWEGSGVEPDIKATPESIMDTALKWAWEQINYQPPVEHLQ